MEILKALVLLAGGILAVALILTAINIRKQRGVMEEINLAEHCEALEKVVESQQQQIDALKEIVQTQQQEIRGREAVEINADIKIDALKAQVNELREAYSAYQRTMSIDEVNYVFSKTPEQSLEEHDRGIYNKAIEDCVVVSVSRPEWDGFTEGYKDGFYDGLCDMAEAIRQLYKGE